ncbi:hypothetical protein SAMN05216221_0801 [Pseudomonas oryzae]|uniref:Uncharacterized protein n=1 Tax=Pseudomonas oryzae TaxID=1392877 RepID=A0A1H1NGU9_9PSED|nr:hypothetical protein SAMN05216221_0801 [Pseudomonas oryzae]
MTSILPSTCPSFSRLAPQWILQLLADFGTSH